MTTSPPPGPLPIEILDTKLDSREHPEKWEQAANRAAKVNEILYCLWNSHPEWNPPSDPRFMFSRGENRPWVNFSFYFTVPGEESQRQSCYYTADFKGRVVAHEFKDDYIEIQSFGGLWSLSIVILKDLLGFNDDNPDLQLMIDEGAENFKKNILNR